MRTPIFDCGFEKSGEFHVKNDLWKNGFCDLGWVKINVKCLRNDQMPFLWIVLVFRGKQTFKILDKSRWKSSSQWRAHRTVTPWLIVTLVAMVRGKGTHVNQPPETWKARGTHDKKAPQRKQNLLRPRRCFWVTLKVRPKCLFFVTTLADPIERTIIEYSDHSLTVLWPFFDLALLWLRTIKKTFNILQLWLRGEIWNRRRRNKYNNFIFQG